MKEILQGVCEIRVGTSGFSFQSWRGAIYPNDVPRGQLLQSYMSLFETVEINSTYYRMPEMSAMARMAAKAKGNFDFMVKVPREFTHDRENLNWQAVRFMEAIKPMVEMNRLAGLLAQFPYSFKFSPANLDYVSLCRQMTAPTALFVEFRHQSWLNRTMYERFRNEQIGYVSVDEPRLPGLVEPYCFATTGVGYVRLHGRNRENWWSESGGRYDYNYTDSELLEWVGKVKKLSQKQRAIYAFFNNCQRGRAAVNAMRFLQLFNGKS